jgi:hypothetical protein
MRAPHYPTLMCALVVLVVVLVGYHLLFGARRRR